MPGLSKVIPARLRLSVEGTSIADAVHILATLRPALIKLAYRELAAAGENPNHVEDLIQIAMTAWFEVTVDEKRAYGYMRNVVRKRVADLKRERADAMTRHPLSLDAPLREQD